MSRYHCSALTVAEVVQAAFHAASPLELAGRAVAELNLVPDHGANVGGSSSEDSGAVAEIQGDVVLVGGGPGGGVVVLVDVGVLDDNIGVEMVNQVLTNGELEPLLLGDHGLAIQGRPLDNGELVAGADTAPEQNLGGTESTSGENDAAGVSNLDGARAAGGAVALELDAGDAVTVADETPGRRVGPEGEVGVAASSDEVGGEGTATLTIREHESGVTEGVVLLVRVGVGGVETLPAGVGKTVGENIEALILVEVAIHRRVGGTRDAGEDAVGSGLHIRRLPALWEVVIPIEGMRLLMGVSLAFTQVLGSKRGREGKKRKAKRSFSYLPPETGVDSGTSTEDASGKLVHVTADNAGRVVPDLVAETWNVESGEVLALEPVRLQVTTPAGGGGRALFKKEDLVAGLDEALGDGNTTGSTTDNDVVEDLILADRSALGGIRVVGGVLLLGVGGLLGGSSLLGSSGLLGGSGLLGRRSLDGLLRLFLLLGRGYCLDGCLGLLGHLGAAPLSGSSRLIAGACVPSGLILVIPVSGAGPDGSGLLSGSTASGPEAARSPVVLSDSAGSYDGRWISLGYSHGASFEESTWCWKSTSVVKGLPTERGCRNSCGSDGSRKLHDVLLE